VGKPLTAGPPAKRTATSNVLRDAMAVDSLDSCGIYFGTTGGSGVRLRGFGATTGLPSSAIFRPWCPSRCRHCHDPGRAPRCTCEPLAHVGLEVQLDVEGPVTQRSVLDALESSLIQCCAGTIRDHVTQIRRPFLRFFRQRARPFPRATRRPRSPTPSRSGAEPLLVPWGRSRADKE